MASLKYLNIYVLLLRCLGICPAGFSITKQRLVCNARDALIAKIITAVLLIAMEAFLLIIIHMAFENDLQLYRGFKTGYILLTLQLISASLVQLFESIFLFFFKDIQVEMLNIIYKHAYAYAKKSSADEYHLDQSFRRTFIIHISVFVIHELNSLSIIWSHNLSIKFLLCLSFAMILRPMVCCIVMSSYTYVVFVLCRFLAIYNDSLIHLMKSKFPKRSKLQEIMTLHGELISLSCQQLSQIYGIAMLLESSYVLSVLPSFPALILMIIEWRISNKLLLLGISLRSLAWVLPPFLILIQAFAINEINLEANRTVKILTKFPRTGTGLDKMVDKFLMKKLRKKPILTAYGFFPLDRSALFKLFTAIIMYIVILVQFKDIEKSIEKTS